ncbi:hypothetical protein [Nonomuraea cavernae]|uniref:WXG100-like domain-containing protein n=1 Tax=Nonomuraea cavernae TaxID=2045107 RepID=UPI003403F43C
MGVILPLWADGILALAGIPWPNIDEDELRLDADAWRTVLAGTSTAAAHADSTVAQTTSPAVYQGDSATALAGYWEKTGGGGHLNEAATAAKYAPVILDGGANVITATKVAVVSYAASCAVKLSATMLAGGPLALGTAAATVLGTRYAMGKVLKEAGEGGARVLAPGLARRVTEPLARILRNARGPWGGGPPLALAGGPRLPTRLPRSRPTGVDGPNGPTVAQMGWRRPNSSNKTNSGTHRGVASKPTRAQAEADARRAAADGGSRAVYRGPCSKGDHVHVDYLNNKGEIMHTRHFDFEG